MANVLVVVSFIVAAASMTLFVVSALADARPAKSAMAGKRNNSLGRQLLQTMFSIIKVVNYAVIFLAIYSSFTDPHSSFTQARPYLTVAAIVGFATLVGKVALSTAIVPFIKGASTMIGGLVAKLGWDKWQARKPRGPEPQG